jgi:acetyl-CoA acyltransferase
MNEAVIIDCLRTPIGKAPRGALRDIRPDDLAAHVLRALLAAYPQVAPEDIDDVMLGCSTPEGESGYNIARMSLLRAGLPDVVPGVTINRFCSSGLQAIAMAADRIRSGGAHIILAGGVESMSKQPFSADKLNPNPWFIEHRPEVYLTMGLTAERLQHRYGIKREAADEFAYNSHRKALAANFDEEIVPINGLAKDEGPRADTSLEALAKLKPVFHANGTVTAGNSSQTSDGAAAALVMSDKRAKQLGLTPAARYVSYAAAGVPPEIMGIGPVVAIPKALKLAGIELDAIDTIELNEAFAVQALAVMQVAELDPSKVNPKGGAIALGHPLGCTGAKLLATALRTMKRYALITMCVGGGQGAAGIFERMN